MKLPVKYPLRNLMRRKVRTLLTIFGISLVVMILVIMLAMGEGLNTTFVSGSPENVVVLEKGTSIQEFSSISKNAANEMKYVPHVKKKGDIPLVSPELYLSSWTSNYGEDDQHFMMVRGVEPVAFDVNNGVTIIEGSAPARNGEIIIGEKVPFKMGNNDMAVGDKLVFESREWVISGIFEAKDSAMDSEIWTDINDLMTASNRDEYSTVVIKAEQPENIDQISAYLDSKSDILVQSQSEIDYYSSLGSMFTPLSTFGILAAVIVSIAAVLGGMNTMFTSIAGRIREMGTLRAIGFSNHDVVLSILIESITISFIGGLIGCIAGYAANGVSMDMIMMAFEFRVTPPILMEGMVFALVIGIIGGALPALKVARMGVVDALH